MTMVRTRIGAAALAALFLALTSGAPGRGDDKKDEDKPDLLYVPTPQEVVDKMLEMAKVKKEDIVYDLGCGDGRVVVTAAKKFGARGVGVDLNPERIKESNDNVKKASVEKLVDIREGDALKVDDMDKATVVFLYMLPEFMRKLEPIAQKKLKPGTRIVSHDFKFPTWKADEEVEFQGPEQRTHTLYLYTVK
jgi:cyclopropane fatty-acyl-phospholipid synthase-like methyltransferase